MKSLSETYVIFSFVDMLDTGHIDLAHRKESIDIGGTEYKLDG